MAFCRAAKFAREARENERRSPRPPLLLSAPNENCHATQAKKFSAIVLHSNNEAYGKAPGSNVNLVTVYEF